jgi:hypothetical protein
MNLLDQHIKIFVRNWKLGLMILAITSLFLLPAIYISDHHDANSWWFIMTSLPIYGMTLAFFVAETQKELMSRGTGFLLPNLGKAVTSVQVLIMSIFGLASFLMAFFLPELLPVTTGNFLHSLTLCCLVMMFFTISLLFDFLFKYSAWLTAVIVLPFFVYINLGKNADAEFYRQWLGNSGFLLMGSILVTSLNVWLLMALNLPRRLAEQPYISTMQMYKPTKVQEFKNRHAAHKQPKDQSARPLKRSMDLCLEKSSRARFAGKENWAIFWDAIHLGLATGIPRRFMGAWNFAFFIFPYILVIGYADSLRQYDSTMVGWYSAFPFMFASLPLVPFHFLATNPLGLPNCRKATEKAGYLFIGWTVVSVLLLSLLIFGIMHFLSAIMPEFESATQVWSYHPPVRFHTPWLPILVTPVVLFIYFLWFRSSAQMILWGAGMQVFLLFNFLLSNGENGWPVMVVLGISLASWIALPFMWRRRIRRGA